MPGPKWSVREIKLEADSLADLNRKKARHFVDVRIDFEEVPMGVEFPDLLLQYLAERLQEILFLKGQQKP